MRETKIGVGPEDRTHRDLRDPATSETLLSGGAPRSAGGEHGHARGDAIGRFVVLGVLGSGGMGVVYSAYDPQLDRKVAIKLLTGEAGNTVDSRTRLLREAQAMAKIHHPNVVSVHEVGTLGDQVYLAMEFADGGTLRDWLAEKPRDVTEILGVFAQAGRGLAAAHAAGLVHRDFKPDNVLMSTDGSARVTDFGLVGVIAEPMTTPGAIAAVELGDLSQSGRTTPLTEDLTRTGAIMGTPRYMAPEQFRGAGATDRTDQFSFCIALYEALYGSRPFAGATYAEVCSNVLTGEIQPAPKGPRVPGWLRKVLLRGLTTEPAGRFASMNALIGAMGSDPRRRRTFAIAAAAGVLVVGAGAAAAWTLHAQAADRASPCETEARTRIDGAWPASAGPQIATRFTHSGRSYAKLASDTARTNLDKYATRWRALATDVCTAEHASSGPVPDLVVRRRACLDARLDELRTVVSLLSGEDNASYVDHAGAMTGGLRELTACTDATALLAAPGVAAPAIATEVADLDRQLDDASARGAAGDFVASADKASKVIARAKQLAWPPLEARGHLVRGNMLLLLYDKGARQELLDAATQATSHHLDDVAVHGWQLATLAAGNDRSPDAVATLWAVARSAAERGGNPDDPNLMDLSHARALVRLHDWNGGLAACRSGLAEAQKLNSKKGIDEGHNCMVEALVPMGKQDELEPLLAQLIAEKSKELGEGHPVVADYLEQRAAGEVQQGKLAEGKADAQRAYDIRVKLFPAKDVRIAQALWELAHVASEEGDDKKATELDEQALAATDESRPQDMVTIAGLHTDLAMLIDDRHDKAKHQEALDHFEKAREMIEKQSGKDSIELAVLLVNYGQVKSEDSVEDSLALLRQSRDIFGKRKDPRANVPLTAMAIVAYNAKRYADARDFCEQSLAGLDANAMPAQVGHIKRILAESLWETHGDHKRARQLATEARDIWAKLGPGEAHQVKELDQWLATHH
jgi:hypothetical protein